jgi:enoyl-CoA hydratase
MVLTGDYRIGTAGAYKLGLNEVGIGMPVPVLAMELARDRLLPTELVHATLHAKIYDPTSAVAAGYLDEVVAVDATLARAKEEATRLGAHSRSAFKATKTRLRGKTIDHIRSSMAEDLRTLMGGA